jgi:hypothetical protein
MTKAKVKENWRHEKVKQVLTEVIPCSTLLPVDTDTRRTPLIFNVNGAPGQVCDLKNIRISASFKVLQEVTEAGVTTWGPIKTGEKIVPINNFGFSLWEDVHLFVNGALVETSQREYNRQALIKNTLFTNAEEQKLLQSAMFYQDQPGYTDKVSLSNSINRGEYQRFISIMDGKKASFIAPVCLDILQSSGYFPDTVSFSLNFIPTKTPLCILQYGATAEAKKVKVEIVSAELHVPRCVLTPTIPKSVSVDYESCKVLTFMSASSASTFSKPLNVNQIPTKIAVVLLTEDRYHGTVGKSPHYFGHHSVKTVSANVNGNCYPRLNGMQLDFANKSYLDAYNAIFTDLHARLPNFDHSTFDDGHTIYGINFQPGHQDLPQKSPMYGTCCLNIEFATAPTVNLIVLIYCFFNTAYSIDTRGFVHTAIEPKL